MAEAETMIETIKGLMEQVDALPPIPQRIEMTSGLFHHLKEHFLMEEMERIRAGYVPPSIAPPALMGVPIVVVPGLDPPGWRVVMPGED